MTHESLQALKKEWQHLLRLNDWDIVASFADYNHLDGAAGCCEARPSAASAHIDLLDEEDFHLHGDALPASTEISLVHELLHVKAAWFDSREVGRLKKIKAKHLEVFVEHLAQLLVRMKKEKELARLEGKAEGINLAIRAIKHGTIGEEG